MDFAVAREADTRIKHAINGYLKGVQKLFKHDDKSYSHVPSIISMIVILYYYRPEYFTVHGPLSELNDEKDIVTASKEDTSGVYGNVVITKDSKGIFKWTFDIIDPSDCVRVLDRFSYSANE